MDLPQKRLTKQNEKVELKWIKKGLIFKPSRNFDWVLSHASVPLADKISSSLYRIYFAGRNSENMSQIGYLEIDINDPTNILHITKKPVLKLGELGAFDDSGVWPSWIISYTGKKYLYYTGWMQGKRIPYYAAIGLAISNDGGKTFKKYSKAPLLPRVDIDPYMNSSPCVVVEDGLWRMWYGSHVMWEDKTKPYYHIKYAESEDPVNWDRKDIICIDFKSKEEYAIARPYIIREDGIYKMWYSYCSGFYRIGYAESDDGITWERKDGEAGIDVSSSGWDSKMIEYPYIIEHQGTKYMFYNGNNYGKSGFGYAVLKNNVR